MSNYLGNLGELPSKIGGLELKTGAPYSSSLAPNSTNACNNFILTQAERSPVANQIKLSKVMLLCNFKAET